MSPHVYAPPGVHTTMQAQVANARNAQPGDAELRRLRAAVAADPGSVGARLELARHYASLRMPELALDHLREARRSQPEQPDLAMEEAGLLRGMGLRAQSARVMKDLIERSSAAPAEAHAWLGIDLDELGRHQEAEAAHREAIARAPQSAAWHNNLGYNLYLQERPEAAQAEWRETLKLEPGHALAKNNLTMIGRRDAPLLAGASVAARNNRAAALIEQGRYLDAREELNRLLADQPGYAPALENLRVVAALDGQPAAYRPKIEGPWWKRMRHTMKEVFVGTWDTPATPAAPAPGAGGSD
jgi:tetratricopeptide (TPR) repeat protein